MKRIGIIISAIVVAYFVVYFGVRMALHDEFVYVFDNYEITKK